MHEGAVRKDAVSSMGQRTLSLDPEHASSGVTSYNLPATCPAVTGPLSED